VVIIHRLSLLTCIFCLFRQAVQMISLLYYRHHITIWLTSIAVTYILLQSLLQKVSMSSFLNF